MVESAVTAVESTTAAVSTTVESLVVVSVEVLVQADSIATAANNKIDFFITLFFVGLLNIRLLIWFPKFIWWRWRDSNPRPVTAVINQFITSLDLMYLIGITILDSIDVKSRQHSDQ